MTVVWDVYSSLFFQQLTYRNGVHEIQSGLHTEFLNIALFKFLFSKSLNFHFSDDMHMFAAIVLLLYPKRKVFCIKNKDYVEHMKKLSICQFEQTSILSHIRRKIT